MVAVNVARPARPEESPAAKPAPASRTRFDVALLVAGSAILFIALVRLDAFERFADWSRAHESWQVDKVLMAAAVFAIACGLFALRRWRDLEDEMARRKDAEATSERLRGLVPICAGCKKIRDGQGSWVAVEVYVAARTEAAFSHGICPECRVRLYPELGA
jgi:hypothetical protein